MSTLNSSSPFRITFKRNCCEDGHGHSPVRIAFRPLAASGDYEPRIELELVHSTQIQRTKATHASRCCTVLAPLQLARCQPGHSARASQALQLAGRSGLSKLIVTGPRTWRTVAECVWVKALHGAGEDTNVENI
jgi:hypothetical protein